MNTLLKIFILGLLILPATTTFAVEDVSVEKNVFEKEIILPKNTKLPTRDLNNDGVVDAGDAVIILRIINNNK